MGSKCFIGCCCDVCRPAAAAAAAAAAAKPADDKTYLQYSGAAGVIKVPAHRPHQSGGAPGPMPSPWAAMDPVSFMQRNAFLFAADKNRLAAGTFVILSLRND